MQTDERQLAGSPLGQYHLDELLNHAANGPFFMAHHTTTHATCLVQVLDIPENIPSAQLSAWLASFADRVAPLTALQHPFILPVIDAGHAQGVPFLVFPAISTRTLQARLTQSGPLDVMTAGRYVDQIAGAMQYAHEHAILHGALTTDCIFLQHNGQLVIADFGVQHLLAEDGPIPLRTYPAHLIASAAPEQVRGLPAQEASDVYALGAVLYQILTGYPVYSGRSATDLAHQTLQAPIPSLLRWRSDLTDDLDALLAQALAKDPEQRFRRPGVFANAYHQIVAPLNASRIPFADAPAAPKRTPSRPRPVPEPNTGQFATSAMSDVGMAPPPPLLGQLGIPYPPPRQRPDLGRIAAAILLIALILVSGGYIIQNHIAGGAKATGSVHFFDQNQHHLTALHINATGLAQPSSGNHYQAWLIDDQNEQITSLGELHRQGQQYVLDFAETGKQAAANLLETGNVVEITQESKQTMTPTTKSVLNGTFSPQAFVHIQHLLVSFPTTPDKGGLLTGMVDQINLLHTTAGRLPTPTVVQPSDTTQCLAISMLDILEGAQGNHAQALPPTCAAAGITATGDGYGVLSQQQAQTSANQAGTSSGGYLVGAEDHATLAATQPDASSALRTQAHLVAATIDDMVNVAQRLDSDLAQLAGNPTTTTHLSEIVALTNQLYGGSPTLAVAATSTPETAKGGALRAYAEGLAMADLPLSA